MVRILILGVRIKSRPVGLCSLRIRSWGSEMDKNKNPEKKMTGEKWNKEWVENKEVGSLWHDLLNETLAKKHFMWVNLKLSIRKQKTWYVNLTRIPFDIMCSVKLKWPTVIIQPFEIDLLFDRNFFKLNRNNLRLYCSYQEFNSW